MYVYVERNRRGRDPARGIWSVRKNVHVLLKEVGNARGGMSVRPKSIDGGAGAGRLAANKLELGAPRCACARWRNRPHVMYKNEGIKATRGPPSRCRIVPAVDMPLPEEGEASSFLYSMAHHEHAGKRGAAKSAAGYDRAGPDRSIIIVADWACSKVQSITRSDASEARRITPEAR